MIYARLPIKQSPINYIVHVVCTLYYIRVYTWFCAAEHINLLEITMLSKIMFFSIKYTRHYYASIRTGFGKLRSYK